MLEENDTREHSQAGHEQKNYHFCGLAKSKKERLPLAEVIY